MRIGILDIDTKKEKNGRGLHEKFPNIACGKIYGYHKMNGDEVFHPWNGQKVDRLYISTIFSWSRKLIERSLPHWETLADEILIGGSGWDAYPGNVTKLPPEIELVDPNWSYELYGIDYGIGFTVRGCHVGCGFCMVWRKEGLKEYRVSPIEKLINPKSNHIVLLNNNSFADVGFFEDVEEIRERKLTVNWNQANDITILTPKHAEAIASVDFRNFNRTEKTLHFAFDQMIKTKIIEKDENSPTYNSLKYIPADMMKVHELPDNKIKVSFDMMKVVPEKMRMLAEYGIRKRKLTFYTLIGYDTTMEEDLERFALLQQYDCNVYAMMFRDLTGKIGVDGRGKPQSAHVKPFRDWVNGKAFRNVPFKEFDRYRKAQQEADQMTIFDIEQAI
ncbi:radical SAM domain-containing protein [Brevibacillus borstelensis AK1]|uniref:Radical SAM domain-containing protein n=1 Tax=Brevibacillus borstelensis AK1 TaxID=1300222 RepID=M8EFK6_9BACL|nr:hypothetical protein [Brevibacillus borstelensis]EMT54260.1 radical SAM domain-containing protein [Brevibacillus borstelensis AK1]